MESLRGGEVVVIKSRRTPPRSESPRVDRRASQGLGRDEDHRDRARPFASRFGGPSPRMDDDESEEFESMGKGAGRVSSSDARRGDGGAIAPASLEPAWQVHARRRQRVARAILQAAAARGVSDEFEDEMSEGEFNGNRHRRWSQPPPHRPPQEELDDGMNGQERRWSYTQQAEIPHFRSEMPPRSRKGKGGGKGGKYDGGARGGSGYQVSSTRVHVSNLPKDITEGKLQNVFSQHGDVLGLQMLGGGGRGGGPGHICAIIRFSSNADAEKSIVALHNNYEVKPGDGPISVKLAKPNPRWDN